mgnify:FL=1
MGQYWKPINIESMEWVYSHDYGNGLKLMEHSYVGNNFVGAVMKLLTKGNKWHKKPIVWCGDYYNEDNFFGRVEEKNKLKPDDIMPDSEQKRAILINHTNKEYVRFYSFPLDEIKKKVVDRLEGNDEYVISPLPLLTALGNGRGGGDYSGTDMEKIGIWAKDALSVEFEVPDGFKELKVNFKEG